MKIVRVFYVPGGEIFYIFEWACFRNETSFLKGTGLQESKQEVPNIASFVLNNGTYTKCVPLS